MVEPAGKSGPVDSGHVETAMETSLDMSCDTFYQVTVVLKMKLESDWKHPVVITLSNGTFCSSELIESISHKVEANVVNDQTLELVSDLGTHAKAQVDLVNRPVILLSSTEARNERSKTHSEHSNALNEHSDSLSEHSHAPSNSIDTSSECCNALSECNVVVPNECNVVVPNECNNLPSNCIDALSECSDVPNECTTAPSNFIETLNEYSDARSECSIALSNCIDIPSEWNDVPSNCGDAYSGCSNAHSKSNNARSKCSNARSKAGSKCNNARSKCSNASSKAGSKCSNASSNAPCKRSNAQYEHSYSAYAPSECSDAPSEHSDARSEHSDARSEHSDARIEHSDARSEHSDARSEHSYAPSERSDGSSECSDADMNDDGSSGWKDDANKDPDWDPDYDSNGDITKKPATPVSSESESGSDDNDDTMALECKSCSFRANFQAILTGHVTRKHYEDAALNALLMCRQCGKVEDTIEALREHRETTHGPESKKEHKCRVCPQVFPSFSLYRAHEAGHECKYNCTKCNRAFLTKTCLHRHIGSVHYTARQTKHLRLVCEMCGHQENSKKALQEHQTLKHSIDFGKRLPCSECDKVFQTNQQLMNHVRRHQEVQKPLKCDLCGKFFKQECSLRMHLENIHLRTNRQTCLHCGKTFSVKSHLQTHVNTVHLKLRQLPCPWPGCVKSFGNNWHLQVHMRIHNNKKPLACPHCDFRARQRHALDYHLGKHHCNLTIGCQKNKAIENDHITLQSTVSESKGCDQITPEETGEENMDN